MHRCKQVAQLSQRDRAAGWASNSGVATEWTGMDMSPPPPLLPEFIPGIDANPMTLLGRVERGKGNCKRVGELIRQARVNC